MVIRVAEPGKPAFQLRRGEQGISVFQLAAVDPPLTEAEILDCFRPGSLALHQSESEIEQKGLQLIMVEGADPLPLRLKLAHAEIRPRPGMTRDQFKTALKELE